jgi:hypothetical protein
MGAEPRTALVIFPLAKAANERQSASSSFVSVPSIRLVPTDGGSNQVCILKATFEVRRASGTRTACLRCRLQLQGEHAHAPDLSVHFPSSSQLWPRPTGRTPRSPGRRGQMTFLGGAGKTGTSPVGHGLQRTLPNVKTVKRAETSQRRCPHRYRAGGASGRRISFEVSYELHGD